jgi:hypothetical protein
MALENNSYKKSSWRQKTIAKQQFIGQIDITLSWSLLVLSQRNCRTSNETTAVLGASMVSGHAAGHQATANNIEWLKMIR